LRIRVVHIVFEALLSVVVVTEVSECRVWREEMASSFKTGQKCWGMGNSRRVRATPSGRFSSSSSTLHFSALYFWVFVTIYDKYMVMGLQKYDSLIVAVPCWAWLHSSLHGYVGPVVETAWAFAKFVDDNSCIIWSWNIAVHPDYVIVIAYICFWRLAKLDFESSETWRERGCYRYLARCCGSCEGRNILNCEAWLTSWCLRHQFQWYAVRTSTHQTPLSMLSSKEHLFLSPYMRVSLCLQRRASTRTWYITINHLPISSTS